MSPAMPLPAQLPASLLAGEYLATGLVENSRGVWRHATILTTMHIHYTVDRSAIITSRHIHFTLDRSMQYGLRRVKSCFQI